MRFLLVFLLSVRAMAEPNILLTPDNHVVLNGEINPPSAEIYSVVIKQPKVKYLVINSPGGYLFSGYKIAEAIKQRPDLVCISVKAQSMAAYLLQACKTRYSLPDTNILIHRMRVLLEGNFSEPELRSLAEELKKDEDVFFNYQAKRIGLSLTTIRYLANKPWVTKSGKDAERLGLVDGVVTLSCTSDLMTMYTPSFNGYTMTLVPACPSVSK
jgi:ATP-dependent protease ClpP protease subunit